MLKREPMCHFVARGIESTRNASPGRCLGLEFLVAADIVRTVAIETTLTNVAILGALVVVRTALSWSLVVEMDGRWPWQTGRAGTLREGS